MHIYDLLFFAFQPINSDQRYICESIWTYVRSFSIGYCPLRTNQKLSYCTQTLILVPKRRNERMDEQSESAASQSKDENHDNSHNKNHKKIEAAEVNIAKQLLMEKIAMFKMIHANKCADCKSSSKESRIENLNKIQTLYDKIGYKTSLDQYMIRSTKIRWLTCKEDVEHWKLWDKKQEHLNRNGRSREREADNIKALRHVEFRRSRSRSRERSIDNFRDVQRNRSRDGHGKCKDERRNKEQVKW